LIYAAQCIQALQRGLQRDIVCRKDVTKPVEKRRHDRVNFIFQKHEVSHHDVHSTLAFGHSSYSAGICWPYAAKSDKVPLQRTSGTAKASEPEGPGKKEIKNKKG
jgi:hypothetical protein